MTSEVVDFTLPALRPRVSPPNSSGFVVVGGSRASQHFEQKLRQLFERFECRGAARRNMFDPAREPICTSLGGVPKVDHECICVLQSLRHDERVAFAFMAVVM